jgi:chorismate-pyruvate lyase
MLPPPRGSWLSESGVAIPFCCCSAKASEWWMRWRQPALLAVRKMVRSLRSTSSGYTGGIVVRLPEPIMVDSHPPGFTETQSRDSCSAVQRGTALVSLFHEEREAFAGLRCVHPGSVAEPYAGLLAHNCHMTVAMERFHGGPVSLRVVAEKTVDRGTDGERYAREILLSNEKGEIVQYGIVCLDLSPLPAASRQAILGKDQPLGRILIASGLHREVQAVELLEVTPGPAFGGLMQASGATYGRVAEIRLDGQSAVELLEVVPAFAT